MSCATLTLPKGRLAAFLARLSARLSARPRAETIPPPEDLSDRLRRDLGFADGRPTAAGLRTEASR